MLPTYQQSITNQYEAALCVLDTCVVRCADAQWQRPVARLAFSQAVFHALMHVYNIRHVHHHAAQLTLRLRLDTDVDVPGSAPTGAACDVM
jgi:hypothetical protein